MLKGASIGPDDTLRYEQDAHTNVASFTARLNRLPKADIQQNRSLQRLNRLLKNPGS
jgi:hypothetical protein